MRISIPRVEAAHNSVHQKPRATMGDSAVASTTARTSALKAPNDHSLRVPCYCEENVWRLACRKLNDNQFRDGGVAHQYHVVFVSNPRKCVPMFQQVAAKDPNAPCCWDYHVILLCTSAAPSGENGKPVNGATETVVLDVDSVLPYPCPLDEYLSRTFPTNFEYPAEFLPMFR